MGVVRLPPRFATEVNHGPGRERAQLVRAQRKLAELEYERESGKVVLTEVVGDVVQTRFLIVRILGPWRKVRT
jgi:phage terminase Nu1 subunit (DNA packaging protein)